MAAPTNVRVFAIDLGATRIKWTYTGGSDVKVYRSTDGVSYASVATISVGTTQYDDEDLSNKTKYWYKLTDDNGSTFSSVVTVWTYAEAAARGNQNQTLYRIPRVVDDVTPKDFNDLTRRIDSGYETQSRESEPCDLCVVDGALIIDCSKGCDWFRAVVDQDINSITLLGCDDCPHVEFIIPPTETYGICGWPLGCDYFGDECTEAPIPGGTNGRTALTNGLSYDGYGPSPGLKTTGCKCPAFQQSLTIKCCSADCVLTCS